MKKVKLGWSGLSVPRKILKAITVRLTMAANSATYATPDPPLSTIETATDALILAEAEAEKGGADRFVVRNARLAELTTLMNTLLAYVQLTSKGKEELVSKAAMEVAADPKPWPLCLKVPNSQAKPGANSGTIDVTWDSVKYKKVYVLEMYVEAAEKPEEGDEDAKATWEPIYMEGKPRFTVTGLTTGKVYRFRVAGSNSAGMGPYSEEVSSVAR
jgi:hypothetical protein